MLVIGVDSVAVINAGTVACWLNLSNITAFWECGAGHVVSALLHCVVVACASRAVVAASDNTFTLEPTPRCANLATVAAHGVALTEVAAACGIGN